MVTYYHDGDPDDSESENESVEEEEEHTFNVIVNIARSDGQTLSIATYGETWAEVTHRLDRLVAYFMAP